VSDVIVSYYNRTIAMVGCEGDLMSNLSVYFVLI
jgi:hypothetical protein